MTVSAALEVCRALLNHPPCPLLDRAEDRRARAWAAVQTLAEVAR